MDSLREVDVAFVASERKSGIIGPSRVKRRHTTEVKRPPLASVSSLAPELRLDGKASADVRGREVVCNVVDQTHARASKVFDKFHTTSEELHSHGARAIIAGVEIRH